MDYTYNQYIDDILSGKIAACKNVKLAVKRHANDLKKQEGSFPYIFKDDYAQRAIDFFCEQVHTKGALARQKLHPEPWQQFIIASIYGWRRKDNGKRRFRRVYLQVSRKNGKTFFASGVGLYDLVSEPGAEVYSAATKRDQAKIAFTNAKNTVNYSPVLSQFIKSHAQNLTCGDGKFEALSSDSKMQDRNEYYYRYTLDGHVYNLTRDNILHIPAMIWDGVWGLSPIEYANKAARLGNSMDNYAEHVFDGGIHSKLKVTVPASEKNFSEADAKKLKERLVSAYGGIDNASSPFILTQGMQADALNLPGNSDSQLVENRTYSSKEVAKIFRVPLSMLGETDAKYNNNEQQARNFLQNTLNPWLRLLEQYFCDLLPVYDREDCYIEFDRNAMLQADSEIRIKNYQQELLHGMLTLNDINRMENRPLIDPKIGDVRFMPVNEAPVTPEYIAAYMANQKKTAKESE